jgi:hypothetical protein
MATVPRGTVDLAEGVVRRWARNGVRAHQVDLRDDSPLIKVLNCAEALI